MRKQVPGRRTLEHIQRLMCLRKYASENSLGRWVLEDTSGKMCTGRCAWEVLKGIIYHGIRTMRDVPVKMCKEGCALEVVFVKMYLGRCDGMMCLGRSACEDVLSANNDVL